MNTDILMIVGLTLIALWGITYVAIDQLIKSEDRKRFWKQRFLDISYLLTFWLFVTAWRWIYTRYGLQVRWFIYGISTVILLCFCFSEFVIQTLTSISR